MKKRILVVLLSMSVVFSTAAVSAYAEESPGSGAGENITQVTVIRSSLWTISTDGLMILPM